MRQSYHKVSLQRLCALFGHSRQAYYEAQAKALKDSIANMVVLTLVKDLRADMPMLGTRKLYHLIAPGLEKHGIKMGRDELFDLLRWHGLLVRRRKRMVKTTDSHHWLKKYPNLIIGLTITSSEQLWVSDLTYIKTLEGFSYLSLITDAYSRKIVGYALHPTLETTGCIQALEMGIRSRKLSGNNILIHHSDRGIQYCSALYVDMLMQNGISISMTQSGSPYENALAERVNGIIKNDFFPKIIYQNHLQAKRAIDRIIKVYNEQRPHLSLNYMTPNQAHINEGEIIKRWKKYKRPVKRKEVEMAG